MGMMESPAADNTTADGGRDFNRVNFDTNMVIILAALLCALICALGLNSMVRCILRFTTTRGDPTTRSSSFRSGLKKSALNKIPVFVYGPGSGSGSAGSECPICLGEFVEGEKLRVLPECNHGFHVRCIDTWLGSHSSCPNCRNSLVGLKKDSAAERTTSGGGSGGGGGGGGEEVVVVVSGGS